MKRRNFFKGLGALAGVALLPKGEKVEELIPTRLDISKDQARVEYAQLYSTTNIVNTTGPPLPSLNFDRICRLIEEHYIKPLANDVFDFSGLTKNILSKGK